MKFFVLKEGMPNAPDHAVNWLEICHGQQGKDFIFIDYQAHRDKSRWVHEENKRPYIVFTRKWVKLGASKSLDGAMKIANRIAVADGLVRS